MSFQRAQKTVAIIGAGISGPVLALQILSHPTLRSAYRPILYDYRPDPREGSTVGDRLHSAGAAVGLFPNGLFPLYSLGLRERIDARSKEMSALSMWRSLGPGRGRLLGRAANLSWAPDVRSSGRAIARSELLACLLDAVAEKGGEMQWGKKVVRVREAAEDGRVEVGFAGGEVLKADLVVGADGAYSAVRRAILDARLGHEDQAAARWLPAFVGASGIYGIANPSKLVGGKTDRAMADDTMAVWFDGGNLSSSPLPGGAIRWDLQVVDPEEPSFPPAADGPTTPWLDDLEWSSKLAPGAYDPRRTIEVLKRYMHVYHPAVGSLGRLVETSESIVHSPLRQGIWEKHEIQDGRNIVCIGDASRVLLPSAGQGTNMGIEDATILAKCLLDNLHPEQDAISSAIVAYAEEKTPRNQRYYAMAQFMRKLAMGGTWFWDVVRDWQPRLMGFSKDGKLTSKGYGAYPFDFRALVDPSQSADG